MKILLILLLLGGCTLYDTRRGCVNERIAKGYTLESARKECYPQLVDRGWRYDHPKKGDE